MGALVDAVALAASVLVFRALPIVLWAVVRRRGRLATAVFLTSIVLLGALCYFEPRTAELRVVPFVLLYLGAVALVFHEARALARRSWVRPILALLIGATCVALPSVVLSAPIRGLVLLLGWEATFAIYSCVVDTCRSQVTPGEVLFFVLVDPSLVFGQRAQLSHGRPRQGLPRVIAGFFVLVLHALLSQMESVIPTVGYLGFVSVHVFAGFSIYCAHSGLASMQIGSLGMFGYIVRERYNHPYRARSPFEFWRRWNIWLGQWAYRYLFVPVARGISRRFPTRRAVANVFGVLLTFGLIGCAHDALPWLDGTSFRPLMTFAFVVAALIAIAWRFVPALSVVRIVGDAVSPISVFVAGFAMLHAQLVFAWLAIPAATHRRLPLPLELTLDAAFR